VKAGSTVAIAIKFADVSIISFSATDGDLEANGQVKLSSLISAIGDVTSITLTVATGVQVTMAVSVASDGRVTLTGETTPTSSIASAWATTALNVSVAVTDGTNGAGGNNSWDLAVHHTEELTYAPPSKVAQGTFALTSGDVVDGAVITIGTDSYTFAVGSDSTIAAGANVIDLKNYAATDANRLTAAAKLLSTKDNSKFDITSPGNAATVCLTEKVGKVDYKKEWDLMGTSTATSDAGWKNTATSESVVRIQQMGAATGESLQLQIGDTADDFNQLKVNIADMHCKALGIGDINIGNQTGAVEAVAKIKEAINKVSDVRGGLGATQNRLEHTMNNLSVMTENIQDAESTIRDVDIAEEMMAYTKNNILIQSAQAMLAQANQVPQGVLQLLG